MTADGQSDLTGTDVTWFDVDRTVCDDDGCMCEPPTSVQVKARKRASRRGERYVISGLVTLGPFTEAEAHVTIDRLRADGCNPRLLRVVEDYT